MRYQIPKEFLDEYFNKIKIIYGSWSKLADSFSVDKRLIFGWRKGNFTIPDKFVKKISKMHNMLPKKYKYVEDSWFRSEIGKKGGLIRNKLHGNPGTTAGRRKGGLLSLKKHKLNPVSPFNPISVTIPKESREYAEFIGILLGDGGISRRQLSISLNKKDDKDYTFYVVDLIKLLFNLQVKILSRKDASVSIITISRTELVKHFREKYQMSGNKVEKQVDVPAWIKKNLAYRNMCMRGLIDTDGCFYVDTHIYKQIVYKSMGINFSNRSIPLLDFVKETMIMNGWRPSITSPDSIMLRRKKDIEEYMRVVGTSNAKIRNKFQKSKEG